jgi:OmpA-OmpF porin, OOP family
MNRRRVWTLLASALAAGNAAAQDNPFERGFDAVPVKPTVLPSSFITLDGTELLPAKSLHAELLFDFVAGVLGVQVGETRVGSLIPARLDAHFIGAYSINSRIDVGFDLPITVYQSNGFDQLSNLGFPQTAPPSTALDDFRLVARGLLLPREEFPVGVALGLELRFPTGDASAFTGGLGMLFGPRLMVERSVGPVRLVANLGYLFRQTPAQYLNLYVGQAFTYGIGAQLPLGQVGRIRDLLLTAEIVGSTSTAEPFTFTQSDVFKSPAEAFVGVRGHVYGRWGFEIDAATGLTPPFAGGYGREFFRVIIGVRYDAVNNDRDGDGVPDDVDRCPDQPGLPEHDGCPDRDNDDVPDIDDKCPDEAGPAENDGCPIRGAPLVSVEATRLRLKANIRFETGSATIEPQSFGLLDEVARVLKEFSQIELVRIEGHTDNRGSHAYNLDLSTRRANSVMKYLINKGIDPKRMVAQGYSFDRPLASNATPLGRAKNRRVEFQLARVGGRNVETPAKAPGVEGPAAPSEGTAVPPPPPVMAPAALVPAEKALLAPDAGQTRPDAGSTMGKDSGATHSDAGSNQVEARPTHPDGGTAHADTGTHPDAGTTQRDAGSAHADGGTAASKH